VIIDRLIKSTHFLPIKLTTRLCDLARLYMDKIVILYGVPINIVLDKTTLKFSIVFNKQIDEQTENNQIMKYLLRTSVNDLKCDWDHHLP
jgi:hypothetical protein